MMKIHTLGLVLLVACQQKSPPREDKGNPSPSIEQRPLTGVPSQPVGPSSTFPTQPPALPSTPIDPECLQATAEICEAERKITELTNNYRTQSSWTSWISRTSATPLRHDPQISAVARDWSMKQAQAGAISHNGFFSGARDTVFRQMFGTSSRISRENVAMMTASGDLQNIAQRFATMWYNSTGHRINMLAANVGSIGVGIYQKPGSRAYYATQLFAP